MAHADLLPGSPLGRQFLAGYLGFGHGHALFEQPGPGQVPGTAPLTAGGIRPRAPRRHRRTHDVAPHEARPVIRTATAHEGWCGLLDLGEAGPLGGPGGRHLLLRLQRRQRSEVGADRAGGTGAPPGRRRAGALTCSPAVVTAGGTRESRFLEEERLAGPAVEQAIPGHNADNPRWPRGGVGAVAANGRAPGSAVAGGQRQISPRRPGAPERWVTSPPAAPMTASAAARTPTASPGLGSVMPRAAGSASHLARLTGQGCLPELSELLVCPGSTEPGAH